MAPDETPQLSFGPYADGPPAGRLLGGPLADLERSRLFVAGGARMRKMIGRDRLFVGKHTDFAVTVDEQRNVVALMASLLPPDRDVEDDCYRIQARRQGSDEPIWLSYSWAMLLQLAHEVLGLPADQGAELLSRIYHPDYLPRTFGDLRLTLVAGKRMSTGEKALVLVAAATEGAP